MVKFWKKKHSLMNIHEYANELIYTRDLNDPPDLNSDNLDNDSQQPDGSSVENTNI